ncbi:MAG TPA: ATP-dependent zinc metalloprotease FtsH [Pirellulaceae bacterium]|nr:ATP-dependent zinc metalloprotease FtsH [Pirellulaceae bacterium]
MAKEHPEQDEFGEEQPTRPSPRLAATSWLIPVLIVMLIFSLFWLNSGPARTRIDYNFFLQQLRDGNVTAVEVFDQRAIGTFKTPPELPPMVVDGKLVQPEKTADGKPKKASVQFEVTLPKSDSAAFAELEKALASTPHKFAPQYDLTVPALVGTTLVTILIFVLFWVWLRRTQNQMMGGGFLSGFTRSPAKRYEASRQAITFQDVAGLEGVKADLQELVEFLKNPKKFQKLGGRVPKGVLLMGPPGTGKTLLARAIAGEAGVPFFSVNGSEFIQMFVGVGASRVRDLFRVAKETSPAIIFIDEIDAVGRQRGAGLGGGHDEREQTLNQILSEMDGFSQTDFVIVVAATNRPDVLDPALLRPGRFDRHIAVGRPTQKGRVEIFKVHTREVPLADDVDLDTMASATIGLTGADIRNIVNEAALWAARHDKSMVEMEDFEYARDKVLMGPKREEVLQAKEKEKTAHHEAGHTLLAWTLPGAHRVHKVTIVPRGRSLGSTQTMPAEDRLSMSESELRDHLAVLLAGREAEKMIYDETTVGAENDLERATGLARRMVMNWGMSDKLGPVSFKLADDDPFLGREMHQQRQFSEHTMEMIDGEVSRILRESSERARRLLVQGRDKIEALARALLEKEELDDNEIAVVLGPSVHAAPTSHAHNAEPLSQATAAKVAAR